MRAERAILAKSDSGNPNEKGWSVEVSTQEWTTESPNVKDFPAGPEHLDKSRIDKWGIQHSDSLSATQLIYAFCPWILDSPPPPPSCPSFSIFS